MHDYLIANGFTQTDYNTANSWGFGGSVGTQYTRGDIRVLKAIAHYRHLPSAKFITLSKGGNRLLDLEGWGASEKKVMDAVKRLLEETPA